MGVEGRGTECMRAAVGRYLAALGYAGPGSNAILHGNGIIDDALVTDPDWSRGVLIWLEDSIIRAYPVEERAQMKSGDPNTWKQGISNYIRDLRCPVHWTMDVTTGVIPLDVLTWVLGHAVGLQYEDASESCDAILDTCLEAAPIPENWKGLDLPNLEDLDSVEAVQAYASLCHTLKVRVRDGEESISGEGLKKCVYRVEHEILPLLMKTCGENVPMMLQQDEALAEAVPLGFTTGNDAVDRAARVLRILYLKELRQVQNAIDDAIMAQQEVTANPRTETGRGKSRKSR